MRCTSVSCSFALLQALRYASGDRSEVDGGGGRVVVEEEDEEEAAVEAAADKAEADLLGWSVVGLLLGECWKALGERSTDSPGPSPDPASG
jgi:hypothetical protein